MAVASGTAASAPSVRREITRAGSVLGGVDLVGMNAFLREGIQQ